MGSHCCCRDYSPLVRCSNRFGLPRLLSQCRAWNINSPWGRSRRVRIPGLFQSARKLGIQVMLTGADDVVAFIFAIW